jgi:hypothetical protein
MFFKRLTDSTVIGMERVRAKEVELKVYCDSHAIMVIIFYILGMALRLMQRDGNGGSLPTHSPHEASK